MNYYEAFGYDNLVPNENFARLLNWKGEIIVNDSLYKITPIGTFCFSNATEQSSQIIENYYNQLITEDSISFNSNTYIQLTPDLILYNSFPELNTNDTENGTRALDLIPLKYFSSQSNGWVWRKLSSLLHLGERSIKHYEYLKSKRVNGSLYDYNYVVYAESGTFVSASRKRDGFFKKINGWKDINAEELNIICKIWYLN